MPLYQADILLHRARLFQDKDALVEARRLIEKHGYARRLEELEDAEESLRERGQTSAKEADGLVVESDAETVPGDPGILPR